MDYTVDCLEMYINQTWLNLKYIKKSKSGNVSVQSRDYLIFFYTDYGKLPLLCEYFLSKCGR